MEGTRLYLFSVVAADLKNNTNHIEPNLLLAKSPQDAAKHGLEAIKRRHPDCESYQVGVVHEVPKSFIDQIKQAL